MTSESLPLDYQAVAPNRDRQLITVGVITSIAILVIAFTAKVPTYRINPIFLIPLTWAPYFFRRGLHLRACSCS